MGCKKMSNSMKNYMTQVKITTSTDHSSASNIEGELDKYLLSLVKQNV